MSKVSVEPVITPGQVISKTIRFQGKTLTLHLHMKLFTYPDFNFELVDYVTNENGVKVEGMWQWGSTGSLHQQPLEFDQRQGEGYLQFRTESSWCNGRKKNGRKYLAAIIEVK
jgi:hypothetical protein